MTTEITTTTVTVESPSLWNAVKNIVLFTSKDETLPALAGAHFKIKDNSLILEATDRYRVGQILIATNLDMDDVSLGLVANSNLKALEVLLRESAKYRHGTIEVTLTFGETLQVELDFNTQHNVTYPLVTDYSFPVRLDTLFPDDIVSNVNIDSISVNPRYLKDMATLRDWRHGTNDTQLHFNSTAQNKPVMFVATSTSGVWCQALLMPIRIDKDPVAVMRHF